MERIHDNDNKFDRSDRFEKHILENVGGYVYMEMCSLGLDPIDVYLKKKELEKDGKEILLIVGTNTEFGYLASFVLKDTEGDEDVLTVEDALDKPVFAYVQNVTDEYCSEYGYIQVTKAGKRYKRVH